MTLGQHWFSWSVCWDKSWATLTGVLASKPGPVKTKYLLVRDQAAAASQPDLAPVWPVGMPVSSWHTWTHIFSLGFYLLQTSHHKLESNFTLNVVPVRLPSRDKVPVCPCLIHEEHLLRVSDKTWHWHKMKVELCSIGKIVKNVGRGSLADNSHDSRADTRYKICKKYNTWTSCSEAATSDIKDVSDESLMMIWCDETYLIVIQPISTRGRCQGVLVWISIKL